MGLMRSRKSGCMCIDCDGPQMADRASERRGWQHWLDEYDTHPEIAVPDDECARDHRPCPLDPNFCCTATRSES